LSVVASLTEKQPDVQHDRYVWSAAELQGGSGSIRASLFILDRLNCANVLYRPGRLPGQSPLASAGTPWPKQPSLKAVNDSLRGLTQGVQLAKELSPFDKKLLLEILNRHVDDGESCPAVEE
jgi:hypothetical protein